MSKKSAYPPGFEVFDELPPPDPEHLVLVVAVPLRVVVLACGCQLVDDGGRVLVPAWVGATAEELREIADAVNAKARAAGCGPCHGGRVAGAPAPPGEKKGGGRG